MSMGRLTNQSTTRDRTGTKGDIKSILIGIVIGIFGVTLFFFVIGEAEIKTNMQFGEKVDEND